jgi:hypothetical protein
MTKARNALIALAALLVLGMIAAGPASAKDRNHDKIPDRWEKRHHLSLKVNQAKRDQDGDQLNNLGEFQTGSDPRDEDSDDDGIEDGSEDGGTISAFDGTTLTIDLANGGSITGLVDENTEVKCDDEVDQDGESTDPSDTAGANRRESGDDDPADEDQVESDDESSDDESSDDSSDDADESEDGSSCSVADLAVGVAVHEAEIRVGNGDAVFEEIELAK